MKKQIGILAHISSLPNDYDIGTLGRESYRFIDILSKNNINIWQILPINPTEKDHSPYSSVCSFAGNLSFIDFEEFLENNLISKEELDNLKRKDDTSFESEESLEYKKSLLRKIFTKTTLDEDFQNFTEKNKFWLEDYALFLSLQEKLNEKLFYNWPTDIAKKELCNPIIKELLEEENELNYHKFTQYIFFKQYMKLKNYANSKGVKIFGDLPIYVSKNSSDVWGDQDIFLLDSDMQPKLKAGVPPDYFSEDGQAWGNPVYDWENNKTNVLSWWIQRIKYSLELFDLVRIDHFRGLESFWVIPKDDETAINGWWEKCYGDELFQKLKEELGEDLPIIAEDLGEITPEVIALRDKYKLPGMKILAFAYDGNENNPYLPKNCEENSISYIGTHDNNTLIGWKNEILNRDDKEEINRILSALNINSMDEFENALINTLIETKSKISIISIQDILLHDENYRMNIPGVAQGNWTYRMNMDELNEDMIKIKREKI
ncbi:4-alpha-glucanotransferase [Arcobacter arenosus]|uniref:4-alpha-glucanotransferase n=1 Tax=Arcobacter arenosus TaxID=2576037 RepID=A0A5R8Y473_9BACT|nr:4-alpha-glucanotransferase [Arcobacter arenosus]TLP40768.1 4-alpha-glucanotransferase [Arcobacter arenosus]